LRPNGFVALWATSAGLRELLGWAAGELAAAGWPVTGPAEQHRTWNLAGLFRLPTARGPVWLKATPHFAAAEPQVIAAFVRHDRDLVPAVLAAGEHRMLLAHVPGEDCWHAPEPVVGSALRRLVAAQAALAAAPPPGLPDRRDIAGRVRALLDGGVGELTATERAGARRLAARWPELAGCGLPDTVVHGDFHPGNWRSGGARPWCSTSPTPTSATRCSTGCGRSTSSPRAGRRRWHSSPTPSATRSSSTTSSRASGSTTPATRRQPSVPRCDWRGPRPPARHDRGMERNWAGNQTYTGRIVAPASVAGVQEAVAAGTRVRALGSRHAFNDIADTGVLVSLEALPADIEVAGDTVTVSAATRYGVLAEALHDRGLALANLASLPHISVGGAIATATHGSGDGNGNLATAVAALELVGADGGLRLLRRGDAEFAGSVVALGALGVLTRVTLDVRPGFDVRQDVYPGVPWAPVLDDLDAVLAAGYSVSLFTGWTGDAVSQVWIKSTGTTPPADLHGAAPATARTHMLPDEPAAAVTEQGGVPGPWLDRLPHFRLGHKPSSGTELQSEYLVPRDRAVEAIGLLRARGERIAPLLQISEIRSVASDELWLSGAYGHDVVAFHFTWRLDPAGVGALLADLEPELLGLGARPHWGKCFAATATELAPLYPKWTEFAELRRYRDPRGKFANAFTRRVLG
jgi:xylitol oxidase